ncbi:MAG: hypothetical protein IIC51_04360, partial [Planctomycetes bacterium]|nr:hypothetical protein [Planctomycetota bacterium]
YGNTTLSARIGFTPAEHFGFDLIARAVDSENELDNFGGPFGDDPNSTSETKQRFYRAQGWLFLADGFWEQQLGYSTSEHDRKETNPADTGHPGESSRATFDATLTKIDWQHNLSLHQSNTLTLGLEQSEEVANSTSSSESPVAGTDSEIGNRLYKLLLGLRFDIESSGVTIAIDADAIQPQLGAIALRELVDSVGSSAIGICARIEFGGVQEDPARLLSPLNYRVSVVRICVERATGGDDVGVEFIRQIAPAFRQALAAVRTHSPIIVEGVPDPRAARIAIESLWVP